MVAELNSKALIDARRTMVDCQVRPSDVTRLDLIDAMLWAPREALLPKARRAHAYVGEHVDVAPGRCELDPRTFAKMVDATGVGPDDLVLVVGSGHGYAAAVFSRLAAAVIALEESETLASAGRTALTELGVDTVISVTGPLAEGCAEHAPYDVIFVNGGSERTPEALLDQLAPNGRLTRIAMRGAIGRCETIVKSATGGDAVAYGARPAFDASAPILPGFDRVAAFEL